MWGGRHWEVAHVRVDLPRGLAPERVRGELGRELAPLGSHARLAWEPAGRPGRFDLYWEGLRTHRVDLLPRPAQPMTGPAPEPGEMPRVALVMDDLGWDLRQIERLISLKAPITASVIPHSPHGRESVRLAGAAGLECLAHVPMEAEGVSTNRLGEGALVTGMDAFELRRTLDGDLDDVPGVKGVNNHMGSRLTADESRMRVILAELKRRGLFFLDSRTSNRSVGWELAGQMGLRAARRRVFLDNVQSKDAVLAQLFRLVGVARSEGEAVAICHPHPATFEALEQALPELRAQVRLVNVSALAR